jgi:RNA polymerase sigma-70 factor (ECF subfamily)
MKSQKGDPLSAGYAVTPSTESLSQLFGEHHRRVLTAAYRITGSMADAEDVTQAVFLRLASAKSLMEARPMDNTGTYLYRAGINGALDLLRSRKRAAVEPLDGAADIASTARGSSPETEATSRQLGETLRAAISELPPRAAEMFTLRYLEDLSNREIAGLMGTSQAVVAVTLHNARSRLKKRLTEKDRKINETR